MENKAVIGIEPGVQGGIAVLSGSELIFTARCPRIKMNGTWEYDPGEMAKILRTHKHLNPIVYLEKVHSMPKQGVRSMFNFGKGFGMWIAMAAAFEMPLQLVTPQVWKKKILANTDKSKGAAILKAKQLFPNVDLKPGRLIKDHDGIAEAICIALYGGYNTWK